MQYKFGTKIRKVRKKQQLSMKEVADKADVSESLVSQIERNKVSPAIDTLLKIVDVLDIDLEYLFSEFKKSRQVDIVRAEDRNKMVLNGVVYEQLCQITEDEQFGIESYYLEVEPGCEKGDVEYGHQGKELGIILAGKASLELGNKVYELTTGDSISFDSGLPHTLRNIGEEKLEAIWVTTPPKMIFKEE